MTAAAGGVSTTIYGHLTTSKRRQDLARLLEGPGEEEVMATRKATPLTLDAIVDNPDLLRTIGIEEIARLRPTVSETARHHGDDRVDRVRPYSAARRSGAHEEPAGRR